MEDSRLPKIVMREKIYTRRRRGRPKLRWLDDVQEDLREMGMEGWRRKAQERPVEANSTGGQGSRRAVAPSDDDDDDDDDEDYDDDDDDEMNVTHNTLYSYNVCITYQQPNDSCIPIELLGLYIRKFFVSH
jgi:hypothetical protein